MSTGPSPQSGRRSPYGAQPSPRDPTSQVLSDERLARHLYLMECRDGPQEATGQPTTHVDEADMRRRGEERDHPAQASRSRWSPREDARQEQIRSDELLARRMQADEHESLLASAERMERIINRDILVLSRRSPGHSSHRTAAEPHGGSARGSPLQRVSHSSAQSSARGSRLAHPTIIRLT
eukprot:RCo040180